MIDYYNQKEIKVWNIWESIIHSRDYKNIEDDYDNRLQPQKIVLKECLVPAVKKTILEIIEEEYRPIIIKEFKSKYTKNIKEIKIILEYTKEENINVINLIFKDIIRKISYKLMNYKLFIS